MEFKEEGWRETPLPKEGQKYEDWPDTGRGSLLGLFVRTYASGIRSWVYRWTPEGGGKQQFQVLARCEAVPSVTEARKLANQARTGTKQAPPAPKVYTVNMLLDQHISDTYDPLKESTAREYKRLFSTKVRPWKMDGVGPEFGEWDVKSVTGLHAAALLKDCRKTAKRSATILCYKLSEAWEYGMTLQVLPEARNIWGGFAAKAQGDSEHQTQGLLLGLSLALSVPRGQDKASG